mmetsp:Transcript_759/g.3120  ORF Transcript_759/g.3120 Transcript_759/m.3120 type:complete len:242 (-) Transcript_759:133-858(-)
MYAVGVFEVFEVSVFRFGFGFVRAASERLERGGDLVGARGDHEITHVFPQRPGGGRFHRIGKRERLVDRRVEPSLSGRRRGGAVAFVFSRRRDQKTGLTLKPRVVAFAEQSREDRRVFLLLRLRGLRVRVPPVYLFTVRAHAPNARRERGGLQKRAPLFAGGFRVGTFLMSCAVVGRRRRPESLPRRPQHRGGHAGRGAVRVASTVADRAQGGLEPLARGRVVRRTRGVARRTTPLREHQI